MKVVIVDDSELFCKLLSSDLSDMQGIEVVGQAHEGLEALTLIQKLNPDVVILDIRMPGENGIGVLQKIEKQNGVPVVIMLTNYPYPQYRKKCMEAGADFFFDKSGEFEKVFETLQHLTHPS
ncbi:MAG: response regulator [Gemmatimonadota bacterium]|nr:MAG: response regulator [Gemmatimonadota bacterium]